MTSVKRRIQRVASGFNRKAREYHVPGVVTWVELASMDAACAYCRIELDLEFGTWDHVISFDRGGDNWPSNIVRCCTTCNREKHTKTPAEFAEHQAMLATCARPGCGITFKPRYAEIKRGMARFCSHRCAGMAKGQNW